jgi:hypothetical protein
MAGTSFVRGSRQAPLCWRSFGSAAPPIVT